MRRGEWFDWKRDLIIFFCITFPNKSMKSQVRLVMCVGRSRVQRVQTKPMNSGPILAYDGRSV